MTHAVYSTDYSAHKLQVLPVYDSRVTVLREDGYDWSGYTKIEESGLLDDIEVVDWQIGSYFFSFVLVS